MQDFSTKEQKVVRVHGENVNRRAADGRQAREPSAVESEMFLPKVVPGMK
jgi:hypothetical protein